MKGKEIQSNIDIYQIQSDLSNVTNNITCLAHSMMLDNSVVLKIQKAPSIDIKQCKNVLNLNNNFVNEILDIFKYEQYIVTVYTCGDSFIQKLRASEIDVKQLLFDCVMGLKYLTDKNIIFDLHPNNIIFQNNVYKITDINNILPKKPQEYIHYIAPETIVGKQCTEGSLYSLGILLYDIISQNLLTQGDNDIQYEDYYCPVIEYLLHVNVLIRKFFFNWFFSHKLYTDDMISMGYDIQEILKEFQYKKSNSLVGSDIQFEDNKTCKIVEILGRGQFSIVYLGICEDAELAVKVTNLKVLSQAEIERLSREIQILSKIKNNNNIIKIYNYFDNIDESFIIMDRCVPLQNVIDKITDLQEKEQLYKLILIDCCAALFELKRRQIIHRDLKIDNMVISSDHKDVKLIDFNVAVIKDTPDRQMTNFIGNNYGKAPLQNLFQDYGCDTDIWALGIVMLSLLTGAAYKASTQEEETRKIRTGSHVAIPEHDFFGPILSKMLEKEREERDKFFDWFYNEQFVIEEIEQMGKQIPKLISKAEVEIVLPEYQFTNGVTRKTTCFPLVGHNIFDNDRIKKYEVIEGIGSGAFSQIYKVKHKEQIYAMKVTKIEQISQHAKEVSAFLHFKHRNIVTYYDSFEMEDGSGCCIVLELCFSLTSYVEQILSCYQEKLRNKYFTEIAKILMIDMCSVVSYIHSQGAMHRDIKQANILFVKENGKVVIKLIDFNIAKENENSSINTAGQGTPYTIAPEIHQGKKYNFVADIWSLGIVLLQILLGNRIPYSGDIHTMKEKMNRGDHDPIPEDPFFKPILEKMLTVEPAERMGFYEWFFNDESVQLEYARQGKILPSTEIWYFVHFQLAEYLNGKELKYEDVSVFVFLDLLNYLSVTPDVESIEHIIVVQTPYLKFEFVSSETRGAGRGVKVLAEQIAALGLPMYDWLEAIITSIAQKRTSLGDIMKIGSVKLAARLRK